jgi:hypothetical protein
MLPFAAAAGVTQMLGVAGQFAAGQMAASARRMQYDEELRKLGMRRDFTLSLATARGAASGVEASSATTTDYLSRLTTEFSAEESYLKKMKSMTSDADTAANFANLVGGAASAGRNMFGLGLFGG